MSYHRVAVFVVAAGLMLAACSKDPPPPPGPTGPTAEELERMRQDSIRAAQEAARRADEERMARERAERERVMAAARSTLEAMVFFEYDESRITPEAERILRDKVAILRNSPAVRIRLEGHADERGTSEYNMALGNRRAESVIDFLVGFGLDRGRFTAVSYGEERPRSQGSNESAWAQNRRVEFVITAGADQITPSE